LKQTSNSKPAAAATGLLALSLTLLGALVVGCGGTKVTITTQPRQASSGSTTPASVGGTSTASSGGALSGTNILKNSDFAAGLSSWQVIDQGGSRAHGVNKVEVVGVEDSSSAVRVTRSCPERDGGASGVSQGLSYTLKQGERLLLRARVKADNEMGGALAGSDTRWFPEGPVQFRIFFEKSNGQKSEWYHGFYYGAVPGADTAHFTQLQRGEWADYTSQDIADELGVGSRITEFRVYGFGWDFDGYATEIALSTS
jgi:hypothetical protein